MTPITLTREKLYDEAWTFTGQELRIRYGFSANSLSHLCEQLKIPMPPMGYWIKIRYGKKPARRQLPKLADPLLQTIHLMLLETDESKCRLGRNPIRVSPTLDNPHALVQTVQSVLAGGRTGKTQPVTFTVAEVHRDRALRMLDALIKTFEAEGGVIFQGPSEMLWGRPPDGVGMTIWTSDHGTESQAEQRLALDITSNTRVGTKSHWADMKNQRLEGALRPIVNTLFEYAALLRWERRDRECETKRQEKLAAIQQQRVQADQAAKELAAFGESLAAEAKRFSVALDIRRYLRALRRRRAEAVAAGALVLVDEAWLERADRFADAMDPLLQRVPQPTQGRCPQNLPVADLDLTCDLRLMLAKLGVADLRAMYELKREQVSRDYRDGLWRETCQILETYGYEISGRLSEWERYRV